MTPCTGAPAQLYALRYAEGSLSRSDISKFEEHYFDCPVCLTHLRVIQAIGRELASVPITPVQQSEPRTPHLLLTWLWIGGAIAASLLLSVLGYKSTILKSTKQQISQNTPSAHSQVQATSRPARPSFEPIHFSQLADLSLPAFVAPNLRGESRDAHFEMGMKEYAIDNCRGAIAELSQVQSHDVDSQAAEFYCGVCQMHLGDFGSSRRILLRVVKVGDSSQQEAALYYLAQIALGSDNSSLAREYLMRTISLHGDMEARARKQDRRIADLIAQDKAAKNGTPDIN